RPPTSQAAARHARTQLATLVVESPGALAQRWYRDRDAVALPDGHKPNVLENAATAGGAQRTESNDATWLRRLLALSRRLSSEPLLDRILDEALDTAIEICRAERGFVLLRAGDDFAVSVARGFASDGVAARDFSTQIARQAATSGEPVITIDAGTDARFDASRSIAALRLRSVLAVPLRFRGSTLGCLYIDHRLRDGAFDEDAVLRLRELADIAALAIGNAQLSAEIAGLNRELADELALRERELATARARASSTAPRTAGRFAAIIGDSDAVTTMLAVVERACTTNLPVVIVGESGTGKELVARALHQNGPRRDGPFVAINCGALPDALLESELFGHARGAFTGALRDRAGLFEQAHGGTLFLDEIADTSLAMQTKLLRVLQDGSLRRVGDQQARTVDVRIVAATQSALGDLVAAGRFRDDLRFRLDVIAIAVPPLRERVADILPL
ncbi:MAG TPA: sigma 54-interacting transcriptional regulator, partial [Kofleriaceae bacterium]|nr:sigma 54-interacting transcriptional regulator [Kofleriaceae bacterium]